MKTLSALFLLFIISSGALSGKDTNVLDFGAVPDGKTNSTEAIQKAIDDCSESGGGRVIVPPGRFATFPVFLKSNVELHITKGAVIAGLSRPGIPEGGLVNARGMENVSITGEGTIDGQGDSAERPAKSPRHYNILLFECRNATVRDINLVNAATWCFRIRDCDGVIVRGIKIYSFSGSDGIDIDGKNVIISDCIINSEDDGICFKSDNLERFVENISITNCVIASFCNAIKFGTSSFCGFRNISISNCVIKGPSGPSERKWSEIKGVTSDSTVISGIALEVVDGGIMDQVVINNISMTGIQTPLFIRLGGRAGGPGILKNVVISNITATNESMITSSITGIPGSYVKDVIIKNVIFTYKGTGTVTEANLQVPEKEKGYPENRMFGYSLPAYGLYMRHVNGLVFEDFSFRLLASDARPAIVLDDCHNVTISNFDADPPSGNQPLVKLVNSGNITISGYQSSQPVMSFIRVEGEMSGNIKLSGNDFSNVRSVKESAADVPLSAIRLHDNIEALPVKDIRKSKSDK